MRSQLNILDRLKRERHLQAPQDIYHATAGKIGCLLEFTCEMFSEGGESDFIKTWKDFEKLKKWACLPNPISHHKFYDIRLSSIGHVNALFVKSILASCKYKKE